MVLLLLVQAMSIIVIPCRMHLSVQRSNPLDELNFLLSYGAGIHPTQIPLKVGQLGRFQKMEQIFGLYNL